MAYPKCSLHQSYPLEYYCEECLDLVCTSCVLSLQHRAHSAKITDVTAVLPSHIDKLQEFINQANGHLQGAENIMDNLARNVQSLLDNRMRAEQKVKKYFYRMRSILSDRERYFITQLHLSVDEKKKKVTEKRKLVKESMDCIISSLKSLSSLSQRHNDVLILREEKAIIEKLMEDIQLMNNVHSTLGILEMDTSVTMPCFEDQNFEKICRQVGNPGFRTCAQGSACSQESSPKLQPRSSHNESDDNPPPVPPRPSSVKYRESTSSITTTISDFSGPPPSPTGSNASTDSVISGTDTTRNDNFTASGELGSEIAIGSPLLKSPPPVPPKSPKKVSSNMQQWLEDCKKQQLQSRKTPPPPTVNGTNKEYGIVVNKTSPIPKPRTKLKLINNTCDKNDEAKPKVITVQPPTPNSPDKIIQPLSEISSRTMLGPAEGRDDIIRPCGICVGSDNILIVTDSTNGNVRMLKGTGKFLDYVGKDDISDARVTEPIAVTTDSSGNIYVADKSPPRVLKFSNTGKFLKQISKGLRGCEPHGLAVTHDGNILISDWNKACIHVFDSSGKNLKHFGPSNQSFLQPTGIVIDSRGRVIVTDRASHHVWIFTPDGEMLNHFGWEGHDPGDLYLPYGVTVDVKDRIIVSESGNHRLSIFTDTGEFIQCIGEKGTSLGQFQCPLNICINSNDKVVVADEGNGRLQMCEMY